jgi:ATP-dependent DNA helicase RecG
MTTTAEVELSAVYLDVLAQVRAARPALTLPPACQALLGDTTSTSPDLNVLRTVHHELTHHLRGQVEDLGYDPDMLPAPPAAPRTLTLPDPTIVALSAPGATDEQTTMIRAVPGCSFDTATTTFRFPVAGPVLDPLRAVVRALGVQVSDPAITALRALAADCAANPALTATAVVSVGADGRPTLRFTVPTPALADQFKRVPSLRWDHTIGAFTAPATRLREVLAVAAQHPGTVVVDASATAALNTAEAPLLYDGTLDGLRGVPITDLGSVQGKKAERFAEFGLRTALDLLLHIPHRYLDRSNLTPIRSLTVGQEVGLLATVANINVDSHRRMVRFTLTDTSGKITATYFNAAWQARRFRVGDAVTVYGKVDAWTGGGRTVLQLTNPVMDPVGNDTLPVIPIYPQSAKSRITTWEISTAVAETLRRLGDLTDPMPAETRERLNLIGRAEALRTIHNPPTVDAATDARTRLAFDELFRMQAALLASKATEETYAGVVLTPTGVLTGQYLATLPYTLTGAQSQALAEVTADLSSDKPTHRLIQGDVGSGKTTVALVSLLQAVEAGYQGTLMAPTEILASQLYAELAERTTGLTVPTADGTHRPLRVEFFSNKLRGKARTAAVADLAAGNIDVAVGTHALLVGDVTFARLGLVVIDEQHRFGVDQRASLRAKGPLLDPAGDPSDPDAPRARPDMLVMTATPIPRTAAMTVFGDLDSSVISELPPGRTPIVTYWEDAEPNLASADADPWAQVRAQVAAGRQGYVVCPLVEDSEKMQAASATATFEALRVGALAGLRLGLVHGQQNSDERSATMAAFRDGDLDILVATTVIEVGVNVPNASVIVILDAQRFGIAQLHQLRGRVGRGVHASSCFLVGRGQSSDSRARMEALVASSDGFYLSEVDLALRGHGQVFGAAQSGQSDLRVANLDTDKDLLVAAREVATELLAGDPHLARRPGLRAEIAAVLGDGAQEWLTRS